MNFWRISIQYDSTLVTERGHNKICGQLFREALESHKARILPRHFQSVPETRPGGAYRYAPRSRKWQARKLREGRGDLPLVYTGVMRSMVVQSSIVRATKDHGTLTAKNHYPMTDQRRAEVENFSQRELDRMVGVMGQNYVRKAKDPAFARVRSKKIN